MSLAGLMGEEPTWAVPAQDSRGLGLVGLRIILVASLVLQRIAYVAGVVPIPVALVVGPLVMVGQFLLGIARISLVRVTLLTAIAASSAISTVIADPKASIFSGLLYTGLYGCFIFCVPVDKAGQERIYHVILRTISVICVLGIAQYALQFAWSPPFLFSWKSVVPQNLLIEYNTLNEVSTGSGIYKSNGLVLLEASALSQLASRGLLIAVLVLKDLRYVPLLGLGMLVTFSGTGIILFLVFGLVPLIILLLRHPRYRQLLWLVPVLLPIVGVGLWRELGLDVLIARTGEFSDPASSGYARFTGNAFLFGLFTESTPLHYLFGQGPAMAEYYMRQSDGDAFASAWIKLVTEYGIVGLVGFCTFFYTCAFQATRRHWLATAFLFHWLILDGNLLVPQHVFMAFTLCGFVQLAPAAARRDTRASSLAEARR